MRNDREIYREKFGDVYGARSDEVGVGIGNCACSPLCMDEMVARGCGDWQHAGNVAGHLLVGK
jgi:hypothetical protein